MSSAAVFEVIGYVASALIVVSITQRSILRLRLIGLAGSATFLTYGLLIGAYPIVVVNTAATAIHLWNLRQLTRRRSEHVTALRLRNESAYLAAYLEFHRDEIRASHPDFAFAPTSDMCAAFILRDMVPAGLFVWRPSGPGQIEALLDFAGPEYRDLRMARHLFEDDAGLFGPDVVEVVAHSSVPDHVSYLEKVGFEPDPGRAGRFTLRLPAGQPS